MGDVKSNTVSEQVKARPAPAPVAAEAPPRPRVDEATQAASRQRAAGADAAARARLQSFVPPTSIMAADPAVVAPLVDKAKEAAGRIADAARDVGRDIFDRTVEAVERGTGIPLSDLDKARQPAPEDMKPGDVYTFEAGSSVSGGRGARVGAQGSIKTEVERTSDGYSLRVEGGGGVSLGAGPGKAGVNGKVQVEYGFETADELRKGQQALDVVAKYGAENVRTGPPRELSPQEAQELKEAKEYLAQHTKSVTLTGQGAVEAAARLGIPLKGVDLSAASVSGKGTREASVKLNFEEGRVASVEVSVTQAVEGTASPTAGPLTDKGGVGLEGQGVKVGATVTQTVVYKVPDGVDVTSVTNDPLGALDRARGSLVEARSEIKVKGTYENGMRGHDVEVTLDGSADPGTLATTVDSVSRGELDELKRRASDSVRVKHTEWEKQGIVVKPTVDVVVGEGSWTLESTTRRPVAEHAWP